MKQPIKTIPTIVGTETKEILKVLPIIVGFATIGLFAVIVVTAIANPGMYKLPPVDTTTQHYVKSPMQIPVKK